MNRLEITPACFSESTRFCADMENTGYALKHMYVVADDTIILSKEIYGMFYIELSHYLHKSEKYYITSIGDKIKKEDYEKKFKN